MYGFPFGGFGGMSHDDDGKYFNFIQRMTHHNNKSITKNIMMF